MNQNQFIDDRDTFRLRMSDMEQEQDMIQQLETRVSELAAKVAVLSATGGK